ncbi:hypothetical protein AXG93_961s1300 [Marchantia polymorpha subsp. ruderalis]|uniref:Uncharacterized protein n=1 Tax=Marchantia polymorpha subsp. ruderalis TaxID=1480154 RepID=A0A176VSW7_MARPO|nr:hypothetical protein AXG93_961s1300 [Marchantia polymorpha subsp. ruderalis]
MGPCTKGITRLHHDGACGECGEAWRLADEGRGVAATAESSLDAQNIDTGSFHLIKQQSSTDIVCFWCYLFASTLVIKALPSMVSKAFKGRGFHCVEEYTGSCEAARGRESTNRSVFILSPFLLSGDVGHNIVQYDKGGDFVGVCEFLRPAWSSSDRRPDADAEDDYFQQMPPSFTGMLRLSE